MKRIILFSSLALLLAAPLMAQEASNTASSAKIAQYEREKAAKESELNKVVGEYKAAKGATRETLKVRIELALHELFDLNTRLREEELRRLEEELKSVRADIERRKSSKTKIVNQRAKELLGE